MANASTDEINDWLAEYSELLAHEPGSAAGFLKQHSDVEEFCDLARVAQGLRKQHQRATEGASLARANRSSYASTYLQLAPIVLVMGVGGWYVYHGLQREAALRRSDRPIVKSVASNAITGDNPAVRDFAHDEKAPSEALRWLTQSSLLDNASARERSTWDRDRLYAWAKSAYMQKDYPAARERVESIKEKYPNWSRIHYFGGLLYHYGDMKDFEKSRGAYETAISKNVAGAAAGKEAPFPLIYNNLAMLLLEKAEDTKPYDVDLLNEAFNLANNAIKLDTGVLEREDRPLDDRLLDTKAQILTARAKATEGEARRSWLQEAIETYQEAWNSSSSLERRKAFEKSIEEITEAVHAAESDGEL